MHKHEKDIREKIYSGEYLPDNVKGLQQPGTESDHREPQAPSDRIKRTIWHQVTKRAKQEGIGALPPLKSKPIRRLNFLKVAAAVLLIAMCLPLYYFVQQKTKKTTDTSLLAKNDIAPGGNKATLTLGDGRTIKLDDAQTGQLATQGSTEIIKNEKGEISYNPNGQPSKIQYNTLNTPRGGQYKIILPDGTKVWLNAASSLSYPTAFDGKERLVKMTGEAYFEVAHDEQRPFKVLSGNQVVRVLGTHFAINAYENITQTTLLQGSVKVSLLTPDMQTASNSTSCLLKPGQQSVFIHGNNNLEVQPANTEAAIAWKNGYFYFANESIPEIMKKISRWYDVEIMWEDDLKDIVLGGTVSRFENVSKVLEMLEATGAVHFTIDGRKIIVKN